MFIGYNTNGLTHHDPLAAIALLAEMAYESVALTIDHGLLAPESRSRLPGGAWSGSASPTYSERLDSHLGEIRSALAGYGMRSVIETGARFLLDPQVKHEPTLMSPTSEKRAVRINFLKHAIDMARELRSDCVSFWSGILRDEITESAAFERLASGLAPIVEYADRQGVTLAFEPEPGMFIDTMARFEQLLARIDAPHFRLTLDLGHLHCLGETPIADVIRRWGSRIANIHIEDMRAGVHEHLMFGEGEMDFPPIIAALREVGYRDGVHVELSRHSHDGVNAAKRAIEFLVPLCSNDAL